MLTQMDFQNGDVVKDSISGFTGTVTARVEYITKCVQYLVTPNWSKGQTFSEGSWIDEIRLKKAPKKKEKVAPKKKRSAPGHRGAGPAAPKRAGGQVGTSE